jgi:4a-hydroxytetrahydrobiopterin dehydratase
MARDLLNQDAIDAAVATLHADWSGSKDSLKRSIEFADFPTAVEFVNRLAPACEQLDHHPDLAQRWRWVHIELSTHSAGGVTEMDVMLARTIDEVAAGLPLAAKS